MPQMRKSLAIFVRPRHCRRPSRSVSRPRAAEGRVQHLVRQHWRVKRVGEPDGCRRHVERLHPAQVLAAAMRIQRLPDYRCVGGCRRLEARSELLASSRHCPESSACPHIGGGGTMAAT
jgi:hypothetical protein